MKHLLKIGLPIVVIGLLATSCGTAGDPISDDLYSKNIYPGSSRLYNIGSEFLPFLRAYFYEGHFDQLYISGDSLYIGGIKFEISDNLTAIKGDKGDPGGPGPQGPQGEPGATGTQGIQGEVGPAGPRGDTGEQGIQGLPGEQGIQGIPGDKGDPGDPGPTHANITILDAITEAFTTSLKATYDGLVLASHTHSNMATLNNITEAFTTALKTSYDWLVTNITSAWKATVDNFIASKGIASGLAPLDANSKVPTVNLGGAGADNTKYLRGDQTWQVPPGGSTVGYVVEARAASQATTTDAQTLYWGSMLVAPSATANRWRIYIPKAGTIKAVYIYSYATTAGSNEAWAMNIRLNNTTDTLVQSLSAATNDRVWSNTSLSIAVAQGNYIEIKEVCPTWATNPATVTRSAVIYIE